MRKGKKKRKKEKKRKQKKRKNHVIFKVRTPPFTQKFINLEKVSERKKFKERKKRTTLEIFRPGIQTNEQKEETRRNKGRERKKKRKGVPGF